MADCAGRDSTLTSSPEVLLRDRSEFQSIELTIETDGSLALALDGYWQFSSLDEHVFHEWLVDTAMVSAERIDHVLILGGGDGLAARNALRYPMAELTLVEIDRAVLDMAREIEPLVALNEGSLHDKRVRAVVGDAVEFVANTSSPAYDVIICDFPCPDSAGAVTATAAAFGPEFYRDLAKCLRPGGIVSVQVSREPAGFWPILDCVDAMLAPASARLVELSPDNWANFVFGGVTDSLRRPLSEQIRALSPDRFGSTRILNRSGDRFVTAAYGEQPSFSDDWV